MCASDGVSEFLFVFFAEMKEAGLNYAVLHEWRKLPCKTESDIDMVVDKTGLSLLPEVLKSVESKTGWRIVQKLWYDVPACYYHVAVSPDAKESVALDFLCDESGIGEYRIKSSLLLEDCAETRGIRHMSTESELAYKLAKRRIKGIFREKDFEFIKRAFTESEKSKLAERLRSYIPGKAANEMGSLLESAAGPAEWNAFMRRMRPGMRLPGMNWTFHGRLSWWFFMLLRIFHRICNDTGCIAYVKTETGTDWDFGFVFRKVVVVKDDTLKYALKRKALARTWLLVVTGCDECAVECERGRLRKVADPCNIRNVIIDELNARHERTVS